ncbi:unnamed protein product [Closterium sp. NIES-54]
MKGFKGRGSKKGKAKEGSREEHYSGGKCGNKGGKRCGSKCWYCHVEGHPWFKCRKLPDGWRPSQPSIEGSKGVHGAMGEGMGIEEGDGGAGGYNNMFYHVGEACFEDTVVPASKVALHRSSHWVIDTGALMTMTNQEDLLDEVRPSKAATVVSATGQVVPVRGEGRAMFIGADGRLVGLKRVLLIPGLYANLLSTKALSEAGMKMEMLGTKVFKVNLDGAFCGTSEAARTCTGPCGRYQCFYGRRQLRAWLLELWEEGILTMWTVEEVVMDVMVDCLGMGGAALTSETPSTVSHDMGGAEMEAAKVEGVLQQEEAPVAERGDDEEEVQQPTPSPTLPPRRTTQGKRGVVHGGAKEGAANERPKKDAHPRDFLKYERLGGPKALLVQEDEDEDEKGAEGEMEQICCFGVNLPHEPASMEEALAGDDREAWLNKAIYGLKQAPGCWYGRLVEALEALGFKVSGCDENPFMIEGEEEKVFLLVYVDDILLFSPSLERMKEVQGKLKETFHCKALGPVGYYLGLQWSGTR